MRTTPSPVPVLLAFPASAARQDAWGRLAVLTAGGAELSTAARLVAGETVLLSFELGTERFESLVARVQSARDDEDGARAVELAFADPVERRRLSRALTDVLSRS